MKLEKKKWKYIKPMKLPARDLFSDLNLKLEKGTEEIYSTNSPFLSTTTNFYDITRCGQRLNLQERRNSIPYMFKKIRKFNDSHECEFCQWRITRILLYTYYYSVMYGTHQTSSRFHRNKANNISSLSTSWKRHVVMENFHFAETTGRAMIIRRPNLCTNNTSANRRH